MKTRKMIALALFCLIFISLGCDQTKPKSNNNKSLSTTKVEQKPVSTKFTPEKIGISEMKTDFIAYPNCDGGECFKVEFIIGFKLAGETQTRSLPVRFDSYTRIAGTAKSDPEISEGKGFYTTLKTIDPSKVTVTLVDDQITKIETIEEWLPNNTFKPAVVLWER